MKEESIWNKKLNLAFVYLFIFLCGAMIVLAMTTYINDKVSEFTETSLPSDSN